MGQFPSDPEDTGGPPTSAEARQQRKKIQNRLYQRTFRLRHQQKGVLKPPQARAKHRPYQINRWRLDEDEYQVLLPRKSKSGNGCVSGHGISDEILESTWFPLPVDHLLHLIEYNVFRGLAQNKTMLDSLATPCHRANLGMDTPCNGAHFPRSAVISSIAPDLAGCLTPTYTQMNLVHSSWIDLIPFPAMRDNLIRWESQFNHSDFIRDLVGEQINLAIFSSAHPRQAAVDTTTERHDDTSNPATGLIIWGEPYRTESWEMTRPFLRKWSWAVMGCEELIDSTNRWRHTRGERPLVMY